LEIIHAPYSKIRDLVCSRVSDKAIRQFQIRDPEPTFMNMLHLSEMKHASLKFAS